MTASMESKKAAVRVSNDVIDLDRSPNTALATMVDPHVVALTDPGSPAGEQYRMLRHRLERFAREQGKTVFAVTSAVGGEGKTTTAVNLALTLAHVPGKRVALLDLDLRRGQVHRLLGFQPRIGLADVLAGHAQLDEIVWRFADSGLCVLPAGRPPADPSALLGGIRAQEVLAHLKARFDILLLDLTSLLAVADAQVGLEWADGALMVVQAGETTREVVEMALDLVPADKMCGCVLNGVRPHESAGLEPALKPVRRAEPSARPLLPAEPKQQGEPSGRPALPAHA